MTTENNTDLQALLSNYEKAADNRKLWENLWNDCYAYTFPNRQSFSSQTQKTTDTQIFDSTAPDAAEQLAAGMLGELTPPFTQWIDLAPSKIYAENNNQNLLAQLDEAAKIFHEHLQKSNFILEIHQAFLDSIILGSAAISFTEANDTNDSLFQFSSIPLQQITLKESTDGRLNTIFRKCQYSFSELISKFPQLKSMDSPAIKNHNHNNNNDDENSFSVIEAIQPAIKGGYDYHAILLDDNTQHQPTLLRKGYYHNNPFIAFRWMKIPGENYGRSPIMKLLPDIKTANKVVELILKNAAIAVTGIWQADDDGVLNPSNIKLTPGTIIPKAVGSKGLTPLQPSADFNLSQVLLDELRSQIRRGLLYDQLSPNFSPIATATEVLERSARSARILGATYGRLQSELLLPIAYRGFNILKRKGLIPNIPIDGVNIHVKIQSPIARQQKLNQVQNAMQFVDYATRLGHNFSDSIDVPAMLSWLAQQMDIPESIITPTSQRKQTSHPSNPNLLEENHAQ